MCSAPTSCRLAARRALCAADHRTTCLHLSFNGCRDALRRAGARPACSRSTRRIERVEIVHTGPELMLACAQLRADCEAAGHALAQRGTTPIAGSPRPRAASRSRSFPTTGSSAAFRASRSNRCRLPEPAPLSPANHRVPCSAVPAVNARHIRLRAGAPITRDRRLHLLPSTPLDKPTRPRPASRCHGRGAAAQRCGAGGGEVDAVGRGFDRKGRT